VHNNIRSQILYHYHLTPTHQHPVLRTLKVDFVSSSVKRILELEFEFKTYSQYTVLTVWDLL